MGIIFVFAIKSKYAYEIRMTKALDKLNKFIKENNLEKDDIIDITINQVEVNEYDSDKTSIRLIYWKNGGA